MRKNGSDESVRKIERETDWEDPESVLRLFRAARRSGRLDLATKCRRHAAATQDRLSPRFDRASRFPWTADELSNEEYAEFYDWGKAYSQMVDELPPDRVSNPLPITKDMRAFAEECGREVAKLSAKQISQLELVTIEEIVSDATYRDLARRIRYGDHDGFDVKRRIVDGGRYGKKKVTVVAFHGRPRGRAMALGLAIAERDTIIVFLHPSMTQIGQAEFARFAGEVVFHELVHLLDPKVARKDLEETARTKWKEKPYHLRPDELDAFMTQTIYALTGGLENLSPADFAIARKQVEEEGARFASEIRRFREDQDLGSVDPSLIAVGATAWGEGDVRRFLRSLAKELDRLEPKVERKTRARDV